MNKIGNIAFLLAMVIALLATIGIEMIANYMWIMVVLGIAFAIFTLKEDKAVETIVLALGLSMAAGGLNGIPMIGDYIGSFAGHLAAFMSAAALIVALRWLWNTGNVMGLFQKS